MSTLRRVIAETEYKPGWKFKILEEFAGRPHLQITALVVDSNPPHTKVTINHVQPLPSHWLRGSFGPATPEEEQTLCRKLIARLIDNVEAHELGEWLSFRGANDIRHRPFLPFHGTPGNDDGNPYERSW